MPVAARLAPAPAPARSNTATRSPRRASRHAIIRPITPAPITATSTAGGIAAVASTLCDTDTPDCAPVPSDSARKAPVARETPCIKPPLGSGGDWRFRLNLHPYAGANRVRFKGFPRCRTAQRFLSPLSGISLEQPYLGVQQAQGQGRVLTLLLPPSPLWGGVGDGDRRMGDSRAWRPTPQRGKGEGWRSPRRCRTYAPQWTSIQ